MKTNLQALILLFVINLNSFAQSVDLQKGLVAYYPFDGNPEDKSGNDYHGTVNGATLTSDRNGNPNAAYSFDGYNDYIKLNNNITFADEFTISFWYNFKENKEADFITKGNGSSSGWKIYMPSNGNVLRFLKRPNTFIHDCKLYNVSNQWHFISIIVKNNVNYIYLDNNKISTKSLTSNFSINNSFPLQIGHATGSNYYTKGKIDDIFIYNRALSSTEIAALYVDKGKSVNKVARKVEQKSLVKEKKQVVKKEDEVIRQVPYSLISKIESNLKKNNYWVGSPPVKVLIKKNSTDEVIYMELIKADGEVHPTSPIKLFTLEKIITKRSYKSGSSSIIFKDPTERFNSYFEVGKNSYLASTLARQFWELREWLMKNTTEGKAYMEKIDYAIAKKSNSFKAWWYYATNHPYGYNISEARPILLNKATTIKEYKNIIGEFSSLKTDADLKAYELVKSGGISESSDYLKYFSSGKYLTQVRQLHQKNISAAKLARQKEVKSWDKGDKICWVYDYTQYQANSWFGIAYNQKYVKKQKRIEGYIEDYRTDKSKFQLRIVYENCDYHGRSVIKQDIIWVDPSEGWIRCQ